MHPWKARLDRWMAPAALRVPFSPNQVTLAALALNLGAALLLAFAGIEPLLSLGAVVLLAVGGLLDALDGAIARHRGEATKMGDLLDHFSDRISDLAIFAGWGIGAAVDPRILVAGTVLVALNGYIGTQIEATFGFRSYAGTGRGEFVLAMFALPLFTYTVVRTGANGSVPGPLTVVDWMAAVVAFFAAVGIGQRWREARALAGDEHREAP
jgi:archaetidylinositol phosphate synthase